MIDLEITEGVAFITLNAPATRNAAGITWPSWSSNKYDGDSSPCVPARPIKIRSSQ